MTEMAWIGLYIGWSSVMTNVLYADDEKKNTKLVSKMLRQEGMNLIPVNDARQVIERVRIIQPEVILLDIHMPHINGIDLAQQLAMFPETAHIPIIVLSADISPDTWMACRKLGIYAYIMKPIMRDALVRTIHRALEDSMPVLEQPFERIS